MSRKPCTDIKSGCAPDPSSGTFFSKLMEFSSFQFPWSTKRKHNTKLCFFPQKTPRALRALHSFASFWMRCSPNDQWHLNSMRLTWSKTLYNPGVFGTEIRWSQDAHVSSVLAMYIIDVLESLHCFILIIRSVSLIGWTMSDMNEYDMILLRSTSVRMHEEGESGRVCSSASGNSSSQQSRMDSVWLPWPDLWQGSDHRRMPWTDAEKNHEWSLLRAWPK